MAPSAALLWIAPSRRFSDRLTWLPCRESRHIRIQVQQRWTTRCLPTATALLALCDDTMNRRRAEWLQSTLRPPRYTCQHTRLISDWPGRGWGGGVGGGGGGGGVSPGKWICWSRQYRPGGGALSREILKSRCSQRIYNVPTKTRVSVTLNTCEA